MVETSKTILIFQDLATSRGVLVAPWRQTAQRQGGDAGAAGGQGWGAGAAAAWHAGGGLEIKTGGWFDPRAAVEDQLISDVNVSFFL